ncbi:hypothetical protein P3X46_012621 [Hevea brasiliensis]|uniref:BZIP domain-containing protein n=1 Tax=Hevea brasiliensis TaxID=3981 RepID=A0ABQ9MER7_HEVBR|nr:basic leucine zipper 4-like [Hevea brasiliensis]KAJ9177399.1 hypothetical protein P3X46_012621 [Hevea brasiliensis]
MLSAVPAAFFSSPDSMLGNPFPSLSNGFKLWDYSDLFAATDDPPSPKPVVLSSVSDKPNEPNRSDSNPTNSNSNSDDPNQSTVSVVDERKLRRMISNRESARRSRMRKQRHLENLRNQVNRLRIENRELTNRLRLVLYNCQGEQRENDRLRSEHRMLRQKLLNIRQILMFRQLQQFTSAWPSNDIITTEQTPSSLMTT